MKYRTVTIINDKKIITKLFDSFSDDVAVGLAQNDADMYLDMENSGEIYTYHLTLYKENKEVVWVAIWQNMSNLLKFAMMKAIEQEPNVLIVEDDTERWR